MKKLTLINSENCALVDDEDFDFLNKFRWKQVCNLQTGKTYIELADRGLHRFTLILNGIQVPINKGKGGVDHKNHDTFDNQKHNLRVCTNAENQRNRRKLKFHDKPSSSKYKGVRYIGGRSSPWNARITLDRKSRDLGKFKSEIDAAHAYNIAASLLFRDFAVLNSLGTPNSDLVDTVSQKVKVLFGYE